MLRLYSVIPRIYMQKNIIMVGNFLLLTKGFQSPFKTAWFIGSRGDVVRPPLLNQAVNIYLVKQPYTRIFSLLNFELYWTMNNTTLKRSEKTRYFVLIIYLYKYTVSFLYKTVKNKPKKIIIINDLQRDRKK